MRKALALLPLCLSLAACDKVSSVLGTSSQPQAPAPTVSYDFEINTTSPDQALKTWWRYLDTKEAMEYARCQSFAQKDAEGFDISSVSTGSVEQLVNSTKMICWRSLYEREILEVKQETDTRAIAFVKVTNAIPTTVSPTPEEERARKVGERFKYLIEKTPGGWRVSQVYQYEIGSTATGQYEWQKQYTPYAETFQWYVSGRQ